LSAETYEDANAILDELDYPPLPSQSEELTLTSTPVKMNINDQQTSDDVASETESESDLPNEPEADEEQEEHNPSDQTSSSSNRSVSDTGGKSGVQSSSSQDNRKSFQAIGQFQKEKREDNQSASHIGGKHSTPNDFAGTTSKNQPSSGNPGAQNTSRERRSAEQKAPRRQGGRLRSYVYPTTESNEKDQDTHDKHSGTGHRGIERVLTAEKAEGRIARSMSHTHPGYDIESANMHGGIERYIEVKSLSGYWGETGVSLSNTQFQCAQKYGDKYWLYVVERVEDDQEFNIIRIQNPANSVNQFMFDDGWRDLDIDSGYAFETSLES
jgi:hypothetical protein